MPRPLLIVEDDEDIEFMLADLVTDSGYRTLAARDGVEALEVLSRERPFAIILDLMMPRMNGYGLLEALRKDPALASIPVIVVTAGTDIDRRALGDVQVFRKPFDIEKLFGAIRSCDAAA
jgi:two-component system, chemotaxis family, chemotaxis protein CheY